MLTIKFKAKSLHCAPGTVTSVRRALALETGLLPAEMKLVLKGKVLADAAEEVPAGAKLMLLRQEAPKRHAPLRLTVREIISGRGTRFPICIDPALSHDDLVNLVAKSLRLPPCDECTEVRIFLPRVGSLMRADLTLLDYPIPDSRKIELFAVPCPINPKVALRARAEEQAALLQAAEQSLRTAFTPKAGEGGGSAASASASGSPASSSPEGAASSTGAASSSSSRADDALASALVTPPPPPPRLRGTAGPSSIDDGSIESMLQPLLQLPPSLTEEEGELMAVEEDGVPSEYTVSSGSTSSSTSTSTSAQNPNTAAAKSAPPLQRQVVEEATKATTPASYGIPTRLRTGLMPSHEDIRLVPMMPDLDDESDEMVDAALAHLALASGGSGAAGGESLSSMLLGLSEYDAMDEWDWDAIAAEEEARLEQRCAELVQTLDEAAASPVAPISPRFDAEPVTSSAAGSKHRRQSSVPPPAEGGGGKAAATDVAAMMAMCAECTIEPDDASICATASASACELVAPSPSPGAKEGKIKGMACKSCGCRLPLTACTSSCRCGHAFCAEHMHTHDCAIDYRGMSRRKLREDNPKLEGPKLERL